MSIFDEIQQLKELVVRTSETIGGPYGDPFNEIGTIISVSDPKQLGRVKVQYQDGTESDWSYVFGSNKGLLSTQYIGAQCLIGKASGNSNDTFVLGIFNKDVETGSIGAPVQLTVIDTQSDPSALAPGRSGAGDKGVQCNKANQGRMYLFRDEMREEVAICLRRNNLQDDPDKEIYTWKSLSFGKMIEKGYDPGVAGSPGITDYSEKKGIPECNQAIEGEITEFSEDKKFRTTHLICRKDENEKHSWLPMSSPPTVFRTNLPDCTEKLHGMTAVVDPGDNSELVICLRYQKQMKWIKYKREPMQFHGGAPPISHETFLSSVQPMNAAKGASGFSMSSAGSSAVRGAIASKVPTIASDPALKAVMRAANALPEGFDNFRLLSDIAEIAVNDVTGLKVDELISQISAALSKSADLPADLQATISSLGSIGTELVDSVQNNNTQSVLQKLGQSAANQAISVLPSAAKSVYTAFVSEGALGAINTATMAGLSVLPDEIAQYVSPIAEIGADVLAGAPPAYGNIINAALGAANLSLPSEISNILGIASNIGLSGIDLDGVANLLSSGAVGEIGKLFGGLSGVPGLPSLAGFGSLPNMASAALGLIGAGAGFSAFLGPAGIGLEAFKALTGMDPIGNILGGIPGLGGLFGGSSECPCDPKCRKTKHGEDSDGNKLLEPCGNVISNGHSSFSPTGNPTENNDNPVAKALGLLPTGLGLDLCVPNTLDLTMLIKLIQRMSDMASRMEESKNADFPEFMSELSYTFEAIEKGFKQTDNNITQIESIDRKQIDSLMRILEYFFSKGSSYFPRALQDVKENSKAINELFKMVQKLDAGKDGRVFAFTPGTGITAAIANIKEVPALSKVSQKEAVKNITKIVKPAHKQWKKLQPAYGLTDIANFILGGFPIDLPISFPKCKTKRDKNKVIKDSLVSKINSPVIPEERHLFGTSKGTTNRNQLPSSRSPLSPQQRKNLLDQINYEQDRAKRGEADC